MSPRARSAPRASALGDVTRPRDMARAAGAGALAALLAALVVPARAPEASPGPLARPHREARVACAACHDAPGVSDPARACPACHGAGAHASLRPSHRALAARGELGCTACHPAHGDARGVTFGATGAYVLWASGAEARGALPHATPAGATVPFVPLDACARCHDPRDARDPVAPCVVPGASVAACFDEHQRPDRASAAAPTSCARQHGDARFVAWESARELAPAALAPVPARGAAPWAILGVALGASAATLGALTLARRRRRAPPAPLAPAPRVRLPQIDPTTCLGCYACVDACPFEVLEIQRYVAVVARPADCCGVVLCEQACPNGSLTIREGDAAADRPRVDAHLESLDAPGVLVAGDLSGVPLIKNAIFQGRRAIDRVAATVPPKERVAAPSPSEVDVVIVGAGPAGLSASLRARELGLSYATLEQGTIASSVKSFPRGKLVFDQPLALPLEGELWLREATKEELLAQWARVVRARKLDVREGRRVVDVAREEGARGPRFVVTAETEGGARELVRASRVVLAIGKRGTPRRLACPIAPVAETRVAYALADARSFAGQRVVVVGLGDAAMEAAIALARQPGTRVTVSYRGEGFVRGRARNVSEMQRLVARGDVRLLFRSRVTRIDAREVELDVGGRVERLGFDAALVLIGGVPSWDLVERAGVTRGSALATDLAPTRANGHDFAGLNG